jgi:osmotically-inducible protein OsmY
MTRQTRGRVALHTDADIFVAARHALDQRPDIPQEVRLHVEHGYVTLTGSVRWPAEREEAEHIVRQVAGVQAVVNNIVVAEVPSAEGFEPPDPTPRD